LYQHAIPFVDYVLSSKIRRHVKYVIPTLEIVSLFFSVSMWIWSAYHNDLWTLWAVLSVIIIALFFYTRKVVRYADTRFECFASYVTNYSFNTKKYLDGSCSFQCTLMELNYSYGKGSYDCSEYIVFWRDGVCPVSNNANILKALSNPHIEIILPYSLIIKDIWEQHYGIIPILRYPEVYTHNHIGNKKL